MTLMRNRAGAVVVALLVMTVAVGGCGSSSSTTPVANTAPGNVALVTVGWPAAIITLDPQQALDYPDLGALHLIGGTLVDQLPNGSIVPGLAISNTTSSNGLTHTFKLRPGLKFSNGEPVTANDVKATLERSLNDKTSAYFYMYPYIRSVEAPSPDTVVFKLKQPFTTLNTVLSEETFAIFPASGLAKGKSFFKAPVSAGPYELASWGGGPTATFTRNPYYYGPKGSAAKVVFETIADANARVSAVESGQIDFAADLPPSLLPTLASNKQLTVSTPATYGFMVMQMNDKSPPLTDVRVRRAISLAVDRQEIDKVAWDAKVSPLAGFWPPNMAGYDPSISVAQNLAGAKALLRGTSCQNGCSLTFVYPTAYSFMAPSVLVIQQNLKSIGIQTHLEGVDIPTWYQDLSSLKFQLSLCNCWGYANDPIEMPGQALENPGGLDSLFSGYASPRMNALIARANATVGTQHAAALAEINSLFVKALPYVTLSTWDIISASRLPASVVSLPSSTYLTIGSAGS
jgi:peptide/nickel transport system substrate-binding protein